MTDSTNPACLHPHPDDAARLIADIPSPCVQNHAANLMPLPNGDLACVWFGGSQEGKSDISIYFSRLPAGGACWTEAVKLSDDPARSEQNPVLFPAPDGALWLFYTAQKSGNQDTSIIRCRVSHDHGRTWGPIGVLFDKAGTFVRQPVVVLDNGDWLLPVFYCRTRPGEKWVGDDDVSAVRISSDQGRTWSEVEVPGSVGCVHMNIGKLPDGSLLALFRSRWADHVYQSRSTDGGRTWTAPVPAGLPNNNSSIQFVTLANGHLAVVFNDASAAQATGRRASLYDEIEDEAAGATPAAAAPQPAARGRTAFWGAPRAPMTLAISEDGGRTWPYRRNLETGDGYCMTNNSELQLNREYSYPSIKQTGDGALHIAYTFFRQKIRYARVDEAWVRGGSR
ncbi:sialidase family protein [Propionivibrio sp.]|uniref:sialidase family protein n=1 Tax=Propionivibrio sp. TaxID=2212460 RepID=UPI0039E6C3DC